MPAENIVADDARGFVSAANFTGAVHYRNFETSVPLGDPAFGMQRWTESDVLIAEGGLDLAVPGSASPMERA